MKGLIYIGIILVLCTNVLALGIASDYVDNGILQMDKGESKTYGIRIQNVEDRNVTVKVTSTGQWQIINPQDIYFIPAHYTKTAVNWNIKLPDNVKASDKYPLTWSITEVGSSEGGQVQTTKSINGGITVQLKQQTQWYQKYWQALAATILIILSLMYYKLKKPKEETRNETQLM